MGWTADGVSLKHDAATDGAATSAFKSAGRPLLLRRWDTVAVKMMSRSDGESGISVSRKPSGGCGLV